MIYLYIYLSISFVFVTSASYLVGTSYDSLDDADKFLRIYIGLPMLFVFWPIIIYIVISVSLTSYIKERLDGHS